MTRKPRILKSRMERVIELSLFASRADLSLPALQKTLHVLGAALVIPGEDAVKAKASPEEASRALAAITG